MPASLALEDPLSFRESLGRTGVGGGSVEPEGGASLEKGEYLRRIFKR